MAGSYQEARRLQAEDSLFENQGDAEEAIADTLEIVDEMLAALKWVARDVIQGNAGCEGNTKARRWCCAVRDAIAKANGD